MDERLAVPQEVVLKSSWKIMEISQLGYRNWLFVGIYGSPLFCRAKEILGYHFELSECISRPFISMGISTISCQKRKLWVDERLAVPQEVVLKSSWRIMEG